MHLFMGISGAEHVIEIVKNCLNAQTFHTDRVDMITGKKEKYKVQGVWRPIEFGHYVFPEPCLNEVMSMLDLPAKIRTFEAVPHMNTYNAVLRKILQLKKIPDMKDLPAVSPESMANRTILWQEHTNIIPVGIKEDGKGIRKFSEGNIYDQEWL